MSGNVQILVTWKYSVENHIVPRLWVFEEHLELFSYFVENRWEYPDLFHSGFEKIFPVNPYNSQNMGKANFHSKKKILENTNIRKLRVS